MVSIIHKDKDNAPNTTDRTLVENKEKQHYEIEVFNIDPSVLFSIKVSGKTGPPKLGNSFFPLYANLQPCFIYSFTIGSNETFRDVKFWKPNPTVVS